MLTIKLQQNTICMKNVLFLICLLTTISLFGQEKTSQAPAWKGKFEQLDQLLPTPNEYRTGSGAPGPKYWQQKADYVISVELNDQNQTVTGSETITYTNNSPETLKYLWLQLDQNNQTKDNNTAKTKTNALVDS